MDGWQAKLPDRYRSIPNFCEQAVDNPVKTGLRVSETRENLGIATVCPFFKHRLPGTAGLGWADQWCMFSGVDDAGARCFLAQWERS